MGAFQRALTLDDLSSGMAEECSLKVQRLEEELMRVVRKKNDQDARIAALESQLEVDPKPEALNFDPQSSSPDPETVSTRLRSNLTAGRVA